MHLFSSVCFWIGNDAMWNQNISEHDILGLILTFTTFFQIRSGGNPISPESRWSRVWDWRTCISWWSGKQLILSWNCYLLAPIYWWLLLPSLLWGSGVAVTRFIIAGCFSIEMCICTYKSSFLHRPARTSVLAFLSALFLSPQILPISIVHYFLSFVIYVKLGLVRNKHCLFVSFIEHKHKTPQ